ncbi:hypothetical protein CFP56_039441 [Quercus suber]|uniref:Uncharacterized protein n=1 Tax=Quercus suber TaxID=58331 RepID=A0AAW0IZ78_QUESU
MAGRAAQRDPITLVEIRRMGMWVLFEFNGKASNGYEMKKALVKSKEEELEVTKPTKEEGNGATKMGRVEVTREHGEEVNDGEEGEEPHHSSWDPCNYANNQKPVIATNITVNGPEIARCNCHFLVAAFFTTISIAVHTPCRTENHVTSHVGCTHEK